MTGAKHYNTLNVFLRERFGAKVFKICIDGGFTCPNRDGTRGRGGCVFCGERGSGEHIRTGLTVGEQVRAYLTQRGDRNDKYIAYFQNFSNTYAPIDVLKKRYDEALCDERIVALSVGTRPDCIDKNVAELLASYAGKYYVWVELGLQTASDRTADLINRGYYLDEFLRAVKLLNGYGIDIVVHVIVGLPGEIITDVAETVRLINGLDIKGIKIHSLYVMRGTALADTYERGEFIPITLDEYVRQAAYIISNIRPDIIIHRVTGDCPRDSLVAPNWNADKMSIIKSIDEYLSDNDLRQGCDFHFLDAR